MEEQSQASSLSPLSTSVENIVERFGDKKVTAAQIVGRLLQTHSRYAGGKAPELRVQAGPDSAQRPVLEWLASVRSHYDPEVELDGRLFILGLSRLDSDLAAQLEKEHVLETIREEHEPPFESLLSPRGREVWGISSPPSPAAPLVSGTDRTYLQLDNPAMEDQLGRQPFAETLALYLRYLRQQMVDGKTEGQDEGFLLHLYGPWGSGKSTLLNFLRNRKCAELGS